MIETPLEQYLKTHRQSDLAERLGCRQSAISNMKQQKRKVFVIEHSDGRVELREEKIIAKSA